MPRIKKDINKNFAIEDININNNILVENGGNNVEELEPVIEEMTQSVEGVTQSVEGVTQSVEEVTPQEPKQPEILSDIEEKPIKNNKVNRDKCGLYITQRHLKSNHKHYCKGLKNIAKTEEKPPEPPPAPPGLERQLTHTSNNTSNNTSNITNTQPINRVLTADTPPELPVKGRFDNIIKNMF